MQSGARLGGLMPPLLLKRPHAGLGTVAVDRADSLAYIGRLAQGQETFATMLYATHCIHQERSIHEEISGDRSLPSSTGPVTVVVEVALASNTDESDIMNLSRHLNASIHHFEQTADPDSSMSLGGNESVSTLTRPARHRLS